MEEMCKACTTYIKNDSRIIERENQELLRKLTEAEKAFERVKYYSTKLPSGDGAWHIADETLKSIRKEK